MDTTLLVLCIVLIAYIVGCVAQWRRLNRGYEDRYQGMPPTHEHR